MMSCAGNPWLKTPAMDYIAAHGIRFTRAYTPNPVCSPARVSLITGRFASSFSDSDGNVVRENRGSMRIPEISEEVKNTTIAAFLKQAGYHLIYGGKEHLPKSMTPTALGFTDLTDDERFGLAQEAANYIKSTDEKPYFMMVSLINPHDICYMAIRDFSDPENPLLKQGKTELATLDWALEYPEGVTEEDFFDKYCPTAPVNLEPQHGEPNAINHMLTQRDFKIGAREGYTEKDWRKHRWAYCRLTERVDGQIQMILDALKQSGNENNTLVLFSSDHGDMDGAHRLEHKTTFYEESANIPFLAMWRGRIPEGKVDTLHLVSSGLDLLPTLCDFAGVKGMSDPRGMSLRPLMEGKEVKWRTTLGVESEIGWMVVDQDKHKYIKYDAAGIEERLHDLNKDPYEKTHFTDHPGYQEKLTFLRSELDESWFPDR
ncbi:MAG: sulfatase [Cyclobacteriaceae bacterium]|nr:MAG: sulfatase [Cyclobacteriaceae bacterium]